MYVNTNLDDSIFGLMNILGIKLFIYIYQYKFN